MWRIFLKKFLLFFVTGGIAVTFSEYAFYRVIPDDEGMHFLPAFAEMAFAYGLMTYPFLMAAHYFKARSMWALFMAGCLFGWIVEGAVAAVLYEGVPLSIAWTSMAWHSLISIMFGWYYFRKVLMEAPLWKAFAISIATGLVWGGWAIYTWQEEGNPLPTPEIFGNQVFGVSLLLILCYWIYDRLVPFQFRPNKWEATGFTLLVVTVFGAGHFITFFPLSLLFPLFMALAIFILWRNKQVETREDLVTWSLSHKVPWYRYSLVLLLPVTAVCVYGTGYDRGWNYEANEILAPITCGISLYLFIKALKQALTRK